MIRLALNEIDIDRDIVAGLIPRGSDTLESRRDDARVVEYENITLVQISRQIPYVSIVQPPVAIHDQQPRRVLRLDGSQSDVFLGKLKIERR